MADGRNYLNAITGEIVVTKNKKIAWKYFKADGKVFGYKVKKYNVLPLDADGCVMFEVKHGNIRIVEK